MSRVSPMAFSWDVLVTAWLLRVRRVTGIPFPFLTDWPIKHVGIRGQHKREFQGRQTPEQRPAHRRLQLVWRSMRGVVNRGMWQPTCRVRRHLPGSPPR